MLRGTQRWVTRIVDAARKEFGEESVLGDEPEDTKEPPDFPVLRFDGQIASSEAMSEVLKRMPPISLGYVFVDEELRGRASEWLDQQLPELTGDVEEDEEEEDGEST